jgi:hypothetical protein
LRLRAISSAVEHSLHTGGVAGSIPASPTIIFNNLRSLIRSDVRASYHIATERARFDSGPGGANLRRDQPGGSSTVNRMVAGSSPARGANVFRALDAVLETLPTLIFVLNRHPVVTG